MLEEYDDELKDFDEHMQEVFVSEVERLEIERKYGEFLASNAGKDAGYFKVPSFLMKHTSLNRMKKRIKDLRRERQENEKTQT